ncbi:MAG: hypothetical protein Ct9H300mP17_00460 [Candidatus Nitrosopelagicus sp.]|nr:MAG: hypothetical protein Ct9H300mP17_00460 [Candidatus Nitrosopelagicus sp.]
MAELEIKDLHVTREGKEILKGVNLKTGPGRFMQLWDLMVLEKVHYHIHY